MRSTKNSFRNSTMNHLSRNPKNWFVSFNELKSMITKRETAAVSALIEDYMNEISAMPLRQVTSPTEKYTHQSKLGNWMRQFTIMSLHASIISNSSLDSASDTFSERYYLPYPWYQNFIGSIARECDELGEGYEWFDENHDRIDAMSELPLDTIQNPTFSNFFEARLHDLLTASISKSQYERWTNGDYHIILCSERQSFVVLKGDFAIVNAVASDDAISKFCAKNRRCDMDACIGCLDQSFAIGHVEYASSGAVSSWDCSSDLHEMGKRKLIKVPKCVDERLTDPDQSAIIIGDLAGDSDIAVKCDIAEVVNERVSEQLNSQYKRFITPFPWVEY